MKNMKHKHQVDRTTSNTPAQGEQEHMKKTSKQQVEKANGKSTQDGQDQSEKPQPDGQSKSEEPTAGGQ